MFEDIIGKKKPKTRKKGINLLGETMNSKKLNSKKRSHRKIVKRAMKIRKDLNDASKEGVKPI